MSDSGYICSMADSELNLPERSALLALMTLTREVSNADLAGELGVTIEKRVRERLVERGYIRAWQAGRYRAWMHELTDEGWRRCGEELSSPPPARASKQARLQYGLTGRVAAYMARNDLQVADIFGLEDGLAAVAPDDVAGRIRSVYATLAHEPGGWVGLSRLRDALDDVPRADLDAALFDLVLEPEVLLDPEFNQKTLTAADRAAALRMGGEDMHLISIGRS